MTEEQKYLDYLNMLKRPFTKLCRLRFLNPDGSTAFAVDNNAHNRHSGAFVDEGSISVNLQNGQRRTAEVKLLNLDAAFDYNVNNLWFGTEIAIDEGLVLSDGSDYYIQQGVFLIETPVESVEPNNRSITYNLVDKWANLDGTLFGNLEGTYECAVNTNIFQPISALLAEDRGNGYPLDRVKPIFTEYYNDKTQELPDGSTVSMVLTPYTLTVDGENGTKADVILGFGEMLNAWVGYDSAGALRLDPSQDDISDKDKPVLFQFSQEETQLLGMTYTIKNTEVYNDYIVIGEMMDDYSQPKGRAENFDGASDTNIKLIGRKTVRYSAAGYATDTQCRDLAVWKLKRATVLQKAVSISCTQIMHISENSLVSIVRTDKEGSPVEKHLIQGFTRPLSYNGAMTINCISVNDGIDITVT